MANQSHHTLKTVYLAVYEICIVSLTFMRNVQANRLIKWKKTITIGSRASMMFCLSEKTVVTGETPKTCQELYILQGPKQCTWIHHAPG